MDTFFISIILILAYLIYKERTNNKKVGPDERKLLDIENINHYPYKTVKSLLTDAEMNFFLVLSMALIDKPYYICPKVRLADLIQVNTNDNYQSYFNKIKSKHIDFIICDKVTFKPIFAIELDDSTHILDNRVIRDDFLNNALYSANIKFKRFKVQHTYKVTEIIDKLKL